MTRRHIITISGDSHLPEGDIRIELAERLGRRLVDENYRILTGGREGVMEAASRGARSSGNYRSGDIIGILPDYGQEGCNEFVDIPIATGMDNLRNQIVANSDAVIAIGGGAGTLSEMAFAWMLGRLVIAYEVEGWSGKLANTRVDHRIRYPGIEDDRVFGVRSEEDVMDILNNNLERYRKYFPGMD